MASKKSSGASRSRAASTIKKLVQKALPKPKPKQAKLEIQLNSEDQQRAIACLQKGGKIAITLDQDRLLQVARTRRIISGEFFFVD